MKITTKQMDQAEKEVVETVMYGFQLRGHKMTYNQARNLVGKIGARIMFGKEIADPIIGEVK